MDQWLYRTASLIGEQNVNKIKNTSVAVIGIGGVGGACAEALCRCGIGKLIIIDNDNVDITNINRQLIATTDTVGIPKTEAGYTRFKQINPDCDIIPVQEYYSPDNSDILFDLKPDFIVDAIDTVTSKLDLIQKSTAYNIPIISSMGTGNRLDPTQFKIGDISETAGCGCGLARVMRRELKKRNISSLPVLYSTELPRTVIADSSNGRHSPASISFCPPVAGYIIASYIIKKIID